MKRIASFTAGVICLAAAASFLSTLRLPAQEADHDAKVTTSAHHVDEPRSAPPRHFDPSTYILRTYRLTGVTQQNDANEILIALRNMMSPEVKIYLIASQNAIMLNAPPDQQELARTIVSELDRLKPTYRVKYTLSEIDGGKRTGTQHYSMLLFDGQRAVMKEGSKIPVITGASDEKNSTVYQYLDIGMNFDVTATRAGNTVTLKNKVEQSSAAEQRSLVPNVQEPVVRQAVYEGVLSVPLGKPTVIGSMDVPDSTRRIEIEVVVEPAS